MPQLGLTRTLWELLAAGGIGIIGTVLTYYLVGKRRITLTHRQRLIQEKSARFHEYVMKYYMPTLTSIRSFLLRLEKVIEGNSQIEGEDALKLSFFFFARYLSTEYIVFKEIKATFLGNTIAERVLTHLKLLILELRSKGFKRSDLSKLRKIDPEELFIDFKYRLEEDFKLMEILQAYENWIEQIKNSQFLDFLRCYLELFRFEINEVYEKSWYKENPVKLTSNSLKIIDEVLVKLIRSEIIDSRARRKFLKRFRKR